jgi:hypothetical protein
MEVELEGSIDFSRLEYVFVINSNSDNSSASQGEGNG